MGLNPPPGEEATLDAGLRWRKVVLLSYLPYDYKCGRVCLIGRLFYQVARLEELSAEYVLFSLCQVGV